MVFFNEVKFPKIFGTEESYVELLKENIEMSWAKAPAKVVIEARGVDRPLLYKSPSYHYIGVDIDDKPEYLELYDGFIVQSIEEPLARRADTIVSTTLLEHVPDNTAAMMSIFNALNPNGTTHHYVPSKWHPYSVVLRIVGPKLQKLLIRHLRPGDMDVTGYPAFFNHCDPISMRRLMERTGFVNISVRPFYHAADYFAFFVPAYLIVVGFEKFCEALNLCIFASGYIISAEKPGIQNG